MSCGSSLFARFDQVDDGYAGAHGDDIDHETLESGIAASGVAVLKCEEHQQENQRETHFLGVQEIPSCLLRTRFGRLVQGHVRRMWKKPNQSE